MQWLVEHRVFSLSISCVVARTGEERSRSTNSGLVLNQFSKNVMFRVAALMVASMLSMLPRCVLAAGPNDRMLMCN